VVTRAARGIGYAIVNRFAEAGADVLLADIDEPGATQSGKHDPAMRHLLANVLRRNGYVVLEATNGEAGRRVAEREQPDVILLDLVLPELAGIETLRQPRTRMVQVVVPSASPTELEAVGELAVARLPKPFDAVVRLATVEPWLTQSWAVTSSRFPPRAHRVRRLVARARLTAQRRSRPRCRRRGWNQSIRCNV
jgi:DNA-binding response OmpR family regulator